MLISDVPELKNRPPVLCAEEATPLPEAITAMCNCDYGSIVVLREGHLAGIVTERDLMHKVLGRGWDPAHLKVADVMTSSVETVHLDDELSDGLAKMKDGHFRHLPVVDSGNHIVGMISQSDFMGYNIQDMLHLARETTPKRFFDGFQPWMMVAGIGLYFLITTAFIIAFFGL